MSHHDDYLLYVGSYTSTDSAARGISAARADHRGDFWLTGQVRPATDPSFLARLPGANVLYAVRESVEGRVTAYRIAADGSLDEINSQPSHGEHPCHLAVHPSGRHVFTANYGSGSVAVHPVDERGVLREACHLDQHSGSGPHERQDGPHAHQVVVDPTGTRVLAVDLGTDRVLVHEFDVDSGHVAPLSEFVAAPGSGPRHLVFAPSGDTLYLLHELDSTVSRCDYDSATGTITAGTTLSTVPASFEGENLAAELVISGDGRWLFASNRGHDSIAIHDLAADLRLVDVRPAGVRGPRHIALALSGDVLLVAGEDSHDVRSFRIEDTGGLTPLGEPVPVPAPVCLLPVV